MAEFQSLVLGEVQRIAGDMAPIRSVLGAELRLDQLTMALRKEIEMTAESRGALCALAVRSRLLELAAFALRACADLSLERREDAIAQDIPF